MGINFVADRPTFQKSLYIDDAVLISRPNWLADLRDEISTKKPKVIMIIGIASAVLVSAGLLAVNSTLLGPAEWNRYLGPILAISIALDLVVGRGVAGRWSQPVLRGGLLIVCLVTAGSFLATHWSTGVGNYYSIGSLIPYSDASGYIAGARRILEFGQMDGWAGRRPLPVALYAMLLWLSGGNLRLAAMMMALLLAAALFVAATEIWERWGTLPTVIFMIVVLSGFQLSIGLFMTEGWGCLLATLALPALMRGFERRQLALVVAGGFLWCLACAARPGALFAPVMVALYAAWEFRWGTGFRSWLKLPLAIGVVVGAFALSGLVCSLLVSPRAVGFGSFYYTLYGLANGGTGWASVLQNHPELASLPAVAVDAEVRRLSLSLAAHQPLVLLSTITTSLRQALGDLFAYVCNLGLPVPYQILAIPFWLGMVTVMVSWRRDSHIRFLLPLVGGLILSSPFVPDGGPRVVAATTPFVALLCAVGVSLLMNGFRSRGTAIAFSGRLLLGLSIAASAVCIVGPPMLALRGALVLASGTTQRVEMPGQTLSSDEKLMKVRLIRGSGIIIDESSRPSLFDLGDLGVSRANLGVGLTEMEFSPPSSGYFTSAVDLLADDESEYVYLIFPEQPPAAGGYSMIAAKVIRKTRFGHNLYAARVLTPISSR